MPLSKRYYFFYFFWSSISILGIEATATPYLPQSFLFDWNLPSQPVPIPTTPQCETINITWGRQGATGPSPTAPYSLQVYTSTAIVPFVIAAGFGLSFDWAVPFYPGTQYQICMFDSLGNTGGCQATYTVIPPLSTPNCSNITFPPLLDVQATVDNGPMSQFGWVDQCTDISILPNGTPPYILTIAPALHPPYNITSNGMSSINWTVSLSYASPFFVGVYDSAGNMWSHGPLHSGGGGTTACLAGNVTSSLSGFVRPAVAVGAGAGGLVAGLLIGIAVTFLLIRQFYEKKTHAGRFADLPSSPNATAHTNFPQDFQYSALPMTSISTSGVSQPTHTSTSSSGALQRLRPGSLQYHIEPFVMPDENGRIANNAIVTTPPEPVSSAAAPQQLYVLHHDSNIAPVTILHGSGTEIVELPPRYLQNASQSDVLSEGPSRTDTRSDGSRTEPSQALGIHERKSGRLQA